jgi:hypothetical protein
MFHPEVWVVEEGGGGAQDVQLVEVAAAASPIGFKTANPVTSNWAYSGGDEGFRRVHTFRHTILAGPHQIYDGGLDEKVPQPLHHRSFCPWGQPVQGGAHRLHPLQLPGADGVLDVTEEVGFLHPHKISGQGMPKVLPDVLKRISMPPDAIMCHHLRIGDDVILGYLPGFVPPILQMLQNMDAPPRS